MIIKTKKVIPLYYFKIFKKHKITAVVSTRKGGNSKGNFAELNVGLHVGDENHIVLNNRRILAKAISVSEKAFTCGQQTHSTNIKVVTQKDFGKGSNSWKDGFTETDGLITKIVDVPLLVVTADCASIFIYDPINNAIGIAHSGKKGTESNIVGGTITQMTIKYNSRPDNLLVGIGPCIHSCCYEIDLPRLINNQLIIAGVSQENIEHSNICTCCSNDIFYSHRAGNGHTGRFANVIMLNG
ncbi:MAG: polyphenol oxidase family protein [bacterium]